ncbi:hypothetical protein PG987_013848 [Apiospora arundinis]
MLIPMIILHYRPQDSGAFVRDTPWKHRRLISKRVLRLLSRSIGRRAIEHTSTPPKPPETRLEAPAQQYTKESCDVSKVLVANMGSTELLQSNGNTRTTPDSATLGRPVDNNTKRMTENTGDQNNASNSAEDTEMEVEKLLEHRQLSDGSIEILVKWVGQPKEDASFEPEHEIQQGAAETLYDYWRAKGGRTKTVFYEGQDQLPETYHVFEILHHEKKGTGLQREVQWVGYPRHLVIPHWSRKRS